MAKSFKTLRSKMSKPAQKAAKIKTQQLLKVLAITPKKRKKAAVLRSMI